MSFAISMPVWPYILDVVMPKNESYALHIMKLVSTYYAISEKYYFLVLLHLDAATYTGAIALLAAGTLFISYFLHICGMFEIAR